LPLERTKGAEALKTTELTAKEQRALDLKASGLTLQEIAAAMSTTREPVRQWLAKTQWKLDQTKGNTNNLPSSRIG
jgi:DNA-binding CsgD family transcriptional regulator